MSNIQLIKTHMCCSQAKANGDLLALFCEQSDAVGNVKCVDLCIRFLTDFSATNLCLV